MHSRASRRHVLVGLSLFAAPVACSDFNGYGAAMPAGVDSGTDREAGTGGATGTSQDSGDGASSRKDAAADAPPSSSGRDAEPDTAADAAPAEAGIPDAPPHIMGSPDAGDEKDAGPPHSLSFDDPAILGSFDFITPTPYSEGPGQWAWVPGPNPHLVQTRNVAAGTTTALGTYAIYRPVTFTDGSVAVRLYSTDDDSGGVLFRYQDETHFYLFAISALNWSLTVYDGDQARSLACSGCGGIPVYSSPLADPGHFLRVDTLGHQISVRLDGRLLATVGDATFASGKVGLFTRVLQDANFDDLEITP